jgi:hypothetical protein
MTNCSIPNWTQATGRTSTLSSRPLRKRNNSAARSEAFSLRAIAESGILRLFNAQRSTPNAQRSILLVGRWMLGVESWPFSSFGRVKGAWWPSRSSKPLSVSYTRDRGRFDSYPLRFFSTILVAVSLCETRASPIGRRLQQPPTAREVNIDVA